MSKRDLIAYFVLSNLFLSYPLISSLMILIILISKFTFCLPLGLVLFIVFVLLKYLVILDHLFMFIDESRGSSVQLVGIYFFNLNDNSCAADNQCNFYYRVPDFGVLPECQKVHLSRFSIGYANGLFSGCMSSQSWQCCIQFPQGHIFGLLFLTISFVCYLISGMDASKLLYID